MLKLVQTVYGHFELAPIEPTENKALAIAKSVVYSNLLTDAQAPADRVHDEFDRRGWWYDPTKGTGLWYVRRQALTDSARRETLRMIREGLIHEPGMADVVVTDVTPQGNVSRLEVDIRGTYYGEEWHTVFKSKLLAVGQAPGSNIWDELWDIEWA